MNSRNMFSHNLNQLIEARQLFARHHYSKALAIYLEIAEEQKEPYLFTLISDCYWGLAERDSKYYQESLIWVQKAVELDPDNARLHVKLGTIYWLGLALYEQAVKEYRLAVQLNPNDAEVLFYACSLWEEPEKWITIEELMTWSLRAVQLEPDNPDYWVRLANIYEVTQQYDKSVEALYNALLCPSLENYTVRNIQMICADIARE